MTQYSNNIDDNKPFPTLIEPVLSVRDINETIMYWHDILGFPCKWTWGDPVDYGGVSWAGASLQFSLNPKLAEASKGNSVWIRVRNIEELYETHQKKAKIVSPLESKPWGAVAYTVEEINGYYIHFSAPGKGKAINEKELLDSVRIVQRKPTIAEVRRLIASVGWSDDGNIEAMQSQIDNAVFIAVAENEKQGAIGIAFLLGDNKLCYYIKDVMVQKEWQRNRIGTALMKSVMQWVQTNAPKKSTIGLFTGDHLASFYKQFGFMQACGMYQQVI